MLGENIKILRKDKGLTQEEFAIRLNVVRQTISKWEKGLSVPDAEMLQRIAEVLEVDVTELLGVPKASTGDGNELTQQLARINEQLAIKNRRSRRIWKTVGIVLAVIVLLNILLAILGGISYMEINEESDVTEVSGEPQAHYAEQNGGDADELSCAFAFLENDDAEHDI